MPRPEAAAAPPGLPEQPRRPTLVHRVEYLGFKVLSGIAALLPDRAASAVGAALGWVAGSLLRLRRRVVDQNLARAFPEESDRWRARVAARCYRHLGRVAASSFRLSRMPPEEVIAKTEVDRIELLTGPVAAGRGAVIVTGHLGNWEIGGAAVAARGIPLDAVARAQNNPLFDRSLNEARRRLGMNVVFRDWATHALLRSLRQGRVVAIVADQNARHVGIPVDFFGIPASTLRGPALLSLRTGAPLLVAVALHDPSARVPYRVLIEEVEVPVTGDIHADVKALTQAHALALERRIRQAPWQYMWQHRRWSGALPGAGAEEPPPAAAV